MAIWIGCAASAVFLYFHFRWAMIDPHNPAESLSSKKSNIVKSLLISISIVILVASSDKIVGFEGKVALSFLVGLVLGPAINAPNVPTKEEEPSWLGRNIKAVTSTAGGAMPKALVAYILAVILGVIGIPDGWYVALFVMAFVLNLGKMPVTLSLWDDPGNASRLRKSGVHIGKVDIVRMAILGNICMFAWIVLLYPIANLLGKADIQDWKALAMFLIGMIVSVFI